MEKIQQKIGNIFVSLVLVEIQSEKGDGKKEVLMIPMLFICIQQIKESQGVMMYVCTRKSESQLSVLMPLILAKGDRQQLIKLAVSCPPFYFLMHYCFWNAYEKCGTECWSLQWCYWECDCNHHTWQCSFSATITFLYYRRCWKWMFWFTLLLWGWSCTIRLGSIFSGVFWMMLYSSCIESKRNVKAQ